MRDAVNALAEALNTEDPLKLWSFLVSCLGDVSQDGAVEISGITLSALVERVGLQPQAMRVALHRLKRDGWVESRRVGRVGYHRLSDNALRRTRAVAARIYGPAAAETEWHLVGLPPDAPDGLALLPDRVSAIAISRSFALVSGPVDDVPEDWLVTAPGARDLPAWVQDIVAKAACESGFAGLEAAVAAIDALPGPGALPDEQLDRFALRVLVLHGWRRLVLRSNPAAETAIGAGRAEMTCRARVHGLLERLGPVTAEWFQVAS
ncbi:MAG: hypothetical protein JKY00_12155 [Roseicyclus sp.]|nr:hypothetical protein [Roseicyclus sp.]